MSKTSEQKMAQRLYDSERRTRVSLLLVNTTDADIIEFLHSCPNKQGLIKQLLREHMGRQRTP